jgi:hypothetical protein
MIPKQSGGDGGAQAQRQAEFDRQTSIRTGTNSINNLFDTQFNDDFYSGRGKAYLDYVNPQLDDQYAEARKQLTYALDRAGTLDSTARTSKEAELQKEYDNLKRAFGDKALDYSNTARNNVEGARSNLIGMLNSTGDQQGAINAATGRAAALTAPDTFDPIGQLFANFTGALQTQSGLEKTGALTGQPPRYNTGLFGTNPTSAVKTY